MGALERRYLQTTLTVPSGAGGAGLSNSVDAQAYAGGAFATPATLDATTVIGFQVSVDGTNFYTLKDKSNALVYVTVTLNAAGTYPLPDEIFGAAAFKIFCMTTSGVAVNQTGAKAFPLILKG